MKKILVIQPLRPEALQRLDARADVSYEVLTDFSEANLLAHAGDADAITIRDAPLPRSVLETAPRLKVVSRHGVGFDNIPVEDCTARGIPVTVVGPVNAVSVAEQTLFLIFAAARAGIALDAAVRAGDFAARGRVTGMELRGRTLLLIGYGRIGREVAVRAHAMGMRALVFDPFLKDAPGSDVTRMATLEAGLAEAEILSLHVPLIDATRNMIGARELSLLPRGAIVINASRGGLVDEAALLDAVRSGHLHGAGLDTFAVEPLPADSPLLAERRIVLSPHSAALTEDSLVAMGVATVENALAALDNRLDPQLVVNGSVLAARADPAEQGV